MTAAGLLVLRAALAFVLVSHGGHVLFGIGAGGGLGAGGLQQTADHYTKAGLQPGMLVAVIVGVVQFVSGILIAFGLLARWAAVSTIALLSILIWKEQAQWGMYLNWIQDPTRGHGMEFSIVIIAALVCLFLTGPGAWSFDGKRAGRAAAQAAGRARLRRT